MAAYGRIECDPPNASADETQEMLNEASADLERCNPEKTLAYGLQEHFTVTTITSGRTASALLSLPATAGPDAHMYYFPPFGTLEHCSVEWPETSHHFMWWPDSFFSAPRLRLLKALFANTFVPHT